MQISATFTVGLGLHGQIREYLKRQQFLGAKIEFHEGRGWLDREFIVRGDEADVRRIRQQFATWDRELVASRA